MSKIKFFSLGGLGENGKNMFVCEVDERIFILDAGLKYPSVELYGIDTTKAADFIYMANATSYYVDTIAIFKVEKAEDRENIKSQLETIKKQAMDSMNNYDPEQYKIAEDGEVITTGNYVCLFMTSDVSKVKSTFNDNI